VLQTLVLKKGAKFGSLAPAQSLRQRVTDAGVEKREQNSAPWRQRSQGDRVLQTLVQKFVDDAQLLRRRVTDMKGSRRSPTQISYSFHSFPKYLQEKVHLKNSYAKYNR